ncbi:MAG: S24/S26 family peptidase [Bacteroides sp.]|nr:S24/S26 family peptidase [Bacteroides sp.]MCM1413258.1 S24/S26 family peptidase [Bacteroides sp.]MCM1471432.1 S24/S26 family peptidase [Bacteroides sp.]
MTDHDKIIVNNLRDSIALEGEGLIAVTGRSMLPSLRPGRDVAVLTAVGSDGLQRFDVVMAVLPDGRAVLHRIVAIDSDGTLTLMGDGNLKATERCAPDCVVGRLTAVIRTDSDRRVAPSARFGRMWYRLRPVRRILLKFLSQLK